MNPLQNPATSGEEFQHKRYAHMDGEMNYFAYGSNLDWDQMRARCASVEFVCVAKLPDHRMAFTHRSLSRKCGTADAKPSKRDELWGVVYEIDESEITVLDRHEGYDPSRPHDSKVYVRIECRVCRQSDDDDGMAVQTYVVATPKACLPSAAYRDLILEGARQWRLPASYIRKLKTIQVAE